MLTSDEAVVAAVAGPRNAPPVHVAIIMDGNGRWAARRSLPRSEGHRQGVETVRSVVRWAGEMRIRYLTLYSFSCENWNRPRAEVDYLMRLLKRFIHQDLADLHRRGVRIRVIGRRDGLDAEIVSLIEEAERLTVDNFELTLVVAFNYSGQDEIARATARLAAEVASGSLAAGDITPELISGYLDTAGIPEPDLLIRTSGEQRLSNFLLWQCAYAEFVFVDQHWPDFGRTAFEEAIRQFQLRDRRYGRVAAPVLP